MLDLIPGTMLPLTFGFWVGHVVASFSAFEHHIDNAISKYLDTDSRLASMVTSNMQSVGSKLQLLQKLLAYHHSGEQLEADLKHLRCMDSICRLRNIIIHDRAFMWSPNNQSVGYINSSSGYKAFTEKPARPVHLTISDIADLSGAITWEAGCLQYLIVTPKYLIENEPRLPIAAGKLPK